MTYITATPRQTSGADSVTYVTWKRQRKPIPIRCSTGIETRPMPATDSVDNCDVEATTTTETDSAVQCSIETASKTDADSVPHCGTDSVPLFYLEVNRAHRTYPGITGVLPGYYTPSTPVVRGY